MTELGVISIKDARSILDARNKILAVAQGLGFDSIGATRQATMCSEVMRRLMAAGQSSSIKVELDRIGKDFALVLVFTSGPVRTTMATDSLKKVFDDVRIFRTEEDLQTLMAFKLIVTPDFKPSGELVDKIKEIVGRPTREELMSKLQEKIEELEQTNIKLQEASTHKSQFLANMSHELRTPLNSIIGYTKLILDGLEGDINEEQRKDLDIVYRNSQHLLTLINDLLDLAKIEAGKVVVSYDTFAISDLLSEVIPVMEQLARGKGLRLTYYVASGIDRIYADKAKTKQVLINILGNAIKFTGEGSVMLNVAEVESDFVFSVSDTGIGIKKEDLETIFESFRQVVRSGAAQYEGTGLGLAISKQFVAMQGGRIWAESEPGKGSTFAFTLPKKTLST